MKFVEVVAVLLLMVDAAKTFGPLGAIFPTFPTRKPSVETTLSSFGKQEEKREQFIEQIKIVYRRAQKCLNEYESGKVQIKVGRRANVTPKRDVYYPEDVVRLTCPEGYKFQSIYYRHHAHMWITCSRNHRWLESWPICRGPLENVTCENRYDTATTHNRHWLNQTVNEFHANFHPKLPSYQYGKELRFSCPRGTSLRDTKGLTVMTTRCLKDGKWSGEWPMCKGRTCKYKIVENGFINDENKKLSVGVKLSIRCKPSFFLWGRNETTCLPSLEWSGYPQECVTLVKFRKNCESDKLVMRIRYEGHRKIPYCHYEHIERGSNHYKIAVGISVPMAIGFIIFIVTASFYVRHQCIKMARERATYLRHRQQQDRLLSSLPSYEDAVKSKPNVPPPTFEETFFGTDALASEGDQLIESERSPDDEVIEIEGNFPPDYNEMSSTDLPPAYVETCPSIHSSAPERTTEQAAESTLETAAESVADNTSENTLDNTYETIAETAPEIIAEPAAQTTIGSTAENTAGSTAEPCSTSSIQSTEIPLEHSEQSNDQEIDTLPLSSTSDNLVGNTDPTSIVT